MQAVVAYIRNIDIRKLAVMLGFLTLIEQAIINGQIALDDLPAAWLPHITTWCKNFIFINGLVLIGQPATAVKWPVPPAAVKAAIVGLAIGLTALLLPRPASAQSTSNLAIMVQTTVQQVEAVLNSLINDGQQFVTADLNLAIADAQAQTPPNTVAAACWTAIKGLNFTAIPQGAGVAYLQQRLLDAQAQYVSINQNCNGVAPLFVKAYNAFVTQAQALNL